MECSVFLVIFIRIGINVILLNSILVFINFVLINSFFVRDKKEM